MQKKGTASKMLLLNRIIWERSLFGTTKEGEFTGVDLHHTSATGVVVPSLTDWAKAVLQPLRRNGPDGMT